MLGYLKALVVGASEFIQTYSDCGALAKVIKRAVPPFITLELSNQGGYALFYGDAEIGLAMLKQGVPIFISYDTRPINDFDNRSFGERLMQELEDAWVDYKRGLRHVKEGTA